LPSVTYRLFNRPGQDQPSIIPRSSYIYQCPVLSRKA
jgi:hypothetical protein